MLSISFDNLPESSEEAFAVFESRLREDLQELVNADRRANTGRDDVYEGSYEPERTYVMGILAFLDEYGIDADVKDISELDNNDFIREFGRFKSRVQYITTRFNLRRARTEAGAIGTVIKLERNYKTDVSSHLDKIRKIIEQEVEAGPKKKRFFPRLLRFSLRWTVTSRQLMPCLDE